MKQKQLKTSKNLPAALDEQALKQVKGGFREMPGTISSSLSVRWDEITIRIRDDRYVKGLVTSRPSAGASSDSSMQGLMSL